MDRLEKNYTTVTFLNINVDQDSELSNDFQIESIPSIVLVVDGRIRKRWTGVQTYHQLSAELERHIEQR